LWSLRDRSDCATNQQHCTISFTPPHMDIDRLRLFVT
jgi:hypothetical protein